MRRRTALKALGGLGMLSTVGIDSAVAENKGSDSDGSNLPEDTINPGKYPEAEGPFTRAPGEFGGFDTVLMYLAEGVVDFENVTGDESPDYPDFDTPAEFFQLGLMKRTCEEAKADRREAHKHWLDFWGIKFDDVDSLDDPINDTAMGRDTDGNVIAKEVPTFLHPGIGYTNYLLSGFGVPNNRNTGADLGSSFDGPTTNRDYRVSNKVRDGGWWVLSESTKETPLDKLHDNPEDGTRPKFWFNPETGEKRTGDAGDELDLSGPGGLDAAVFDKLPERTGLFWGEYNIKRGQDEDSLIIHYESRFPTEFRPASGIPRAFICELMTFEFETDRNPRGIGRVHGTAYPREETTDGNLLGTIRNTFTFPPAYVDDRENDAPELPGPGERSTDGIVHTSIAAADGQKDIPGFPSAFD